MKPTPDLPSLEAPDFLYMPGVEVSWATEEDLRYWERAMELRMAYEETVPGGLS